MSESVPGPSILHKYFSPENRMAEVICGLIMVLTFTATTGAMFEGTTPHALLIAVVGCNLAWGIVDGVTYILGNLMTRGARSRLILEMKRKPNDPHTAELLASRIDTVLGNLLTPDQHEQLHAWILQGAANAEPGPTRLKKEDLYTALACFLIVFGATIPVVVPFLLFRNDAIALRVSNGLILVMLFAMGWRWAKFANLNRLRAGLSLLGLGVVLVLITIVLGG